MRGQFGWVSIIYLTDGETRYWEFPKAGSIPVCGKGMIWLTIIPDEQSRCIGKGRKLYIDGEKKYQLTDFMSVSPTNVYKWLALHLDYYSPD